jgi:hypothetical protein
MPPLRTLALLAAMVLAVALSACGEKEEPSSAELAASAPTTTDATTATATEDFDIVGIWQGQLRQQGLKPFTVRARITGLRNSDRNFVGYSGIDCAGRWYYEGRGAAFRFREVINRGKGGKFKGVGQVTLTPVGERLLYEFTGGGVESRGKLHRVRRSP